MKSCAFSRCGSHFAQHRLPDFSRLPSPKPAMLCKMALLPRICITLHTNFTFRFYKPSGDLLPQFLLGKKKFPCINTFRIAAAFATHQRNSASTASSRSFLYIKRVIRPANHSPPSLIFSFSRNIPYRSHIFHPAGFPGRRRRRCSRNRRFPEGLCFHPRPAPAGFPEVRTPG